jgi:hypothetical protein
MKPRVSNRRTWEEIARDLAIVLTHPQLHQRTKRVVVKNAAWAWTAFHGKYQQCPNWTAAAVEHFRTGTAKRRTKGLIHEHAVPIEALFRILLKMRNPSPAEVHECLNKCLLGVVVTKAEHDALNTKFKKVMPEPFNCLVDDPRARYRECGIDIQVMPENWWKQ